MSTIGQSIALATAVVAVIGIGSTDARADEPAWAWEEVTADVVSPGAARNDSDGCGRQDSSCPPAAAATSNVVGDQLPSGTTGAQAALPANLPVLGSVVFPSAARPADDGTVYRQW